MSGHASPALARGGGPRGGPRRLKWMDMRLIELAKRERKGTIRAAAASPRVRGEGCAGAQGERRITSGVNSAGVRGLGRERLFRRRPLTRPRIAVRGPPLRARRGEA